MSFKNQSDDSNGIWVQDLEWRKDDRQYGTYVQYVQYEATQSRISKAALSPQGTVFFS